MITLFVLGTVFGWFVNALCFTAISSMREDGILEIGKFARLIVAIMAVLPFVLTFFFLVSMIIILVAYLIISLADFVTDEVSQ